MPSAYVPTEAPLAPFLRVPPSLPTLHPDTLTAPVPVVRTCLAMLPALDGRTGEPPDLMRGLHGGSPPIPAMGLGGGWGCNVAVCLRTPDGVVACRLTSQSVVRIRSNHHPLRSRFPVDGLRDVERLREARPEDVVEAVAKLEACPLQGERGPM